MLTESQLKRIMIKYNMRPKKSLGQNFLIDRNVKNKIIRKADLKKSDFVLEIGPGPGTLTVDLAHKCGQVIAIEKDKLLSTVLRGIVSPFKNTTVIEGDILEYNLHQIPCDKIKVMGNLPYYITTPIIIKLLKNRECIDFILITVQKEVARRIVAGPGTKNYGSLSLYVQFWAVPTIEADIKKNSFFPRPEVDSSLVKLTMRGLPPVSVWDEEILFKVIRASFGQRRKTLANALSSIQKDRTAIRSALKTADIDPKRRGETLSLEEFARIANAMA